MKSINRSTVYLGLALAGGVILGFAPFTYNLITRVKPENQVTWATCPEITAAQVSYENRAVNTIETIDELQFAFIKDSTGEKTEQQINEGLCEIMGSLVQNNRGIENAVRYADHITYGGSSPMEFETLVDSVSYSMRNLNDMSINDAISLYDAINKVYPAGLGTSQSIESSRVQIASAQGDIAKVLHDQGRSTHDALELITSYNTYFGSSASRQTPKEFAEKINGNLVILAATGQKVGEATFFIKQHWLADDMSNFESASDYVNESLEYFK